MGNIIWYKHHGKRVVVDSELRGKHREHCLCYKCGKFKPDSPDNCPRAMVVFAFCVVNHMVTPVYECSKFVRSNV